MRRTRTPKSPWILLVLAIAMAGAVVGVWNRSKALTARDMLDSAEARYEDRVDFPSALREVNLAIEMAEAQGDALVLADALKFRSRLYLDRDSYELALVDLTRVADELLPEEWDLRLDMIEIDVRAERYEEAVERCRAFLQQKPNHATALTHLARAHRFLGDRIIDEASESFEEMFSDEAAAEARRLALRAAAMDQGSLARASVLAELQRLYQEFGHRDFDRMEAAIGEASGLYSAARAGFADSMGWYPSQRTLQGMVELLDQAGRTDYVADFGTALLAHEQGRNSLAIARVLADAYAVEGRPLVASTVLDLFRRTGGEVLLDYLDDWARILYEGGLWPRLMGVGQDLQTRAPPGPWGAFPRRAAEFYLGMTHLQQGQNVKAMDALERFLVNTAPPPLPDAEATALYGLAQSARAQGILDVERRYLKSAVNRDPDRDAGAWLRMADLDAQLGAPMSAVEHALANAIRLAPESASQLAPRWIEAGQRALFETGIDLALTHESLARSSTPFPSGTTSSYELYALARIWQEEGQSAFAAETARHLLELYPHFPLALDVLILALEDIGDLERLAERLVERVEHGGPGGAVTARIGDLPEGFLSGAQIVRLMQADPFGTGLVELTRELPDDRSRGAAIQGLLRGGTGSQGPEGKVLTARILLGLELWAQALNVLDGFPADSPLYARVLRMKTEAALALGNDDVLAQTLQELSEAEVVDRKELLPVVDSLLTRGKWRAATIPLERLDSTQWSRGGDVMLRLAVAHMMAGDHEQARLSIDRAEAYREDGGPELGRVVLHIERREWSSLPQTVREVLASDYRPTAFQQAVLTALEERLDEAGELAAEGRAAHPEDPLWYLLAAAVESLTTGLVPDAERLGKDIRKQTRATLRGTPGGQAGDPRDTLAILLTLDVPEWNLWALDRLGAAEPGTLWGMYLTADCLQRLDDDPTATRILRLLTRNFPGFTPGWALLERLEEDRLGRPDHPEMLDLRATRRAALGDPQGEEAERQLAAAMRRFERGGLPGAAAGAERALALREDMHAARRLLGRVRVAQGRLEAALDAYRDYFDSEDPELAEAAVEEYLALVERVAEEGILTDAARTAELSALALRFPRDPLVPLALARLDVVALPKRPTVGLDRAIRRLERFRETTADAALEDLSPAAPRAWIDFLLEIDPARAERLARAELERKPGSGDLWLVVGETLEAQDRTDDAIAHYQKFIDMLPNSRALRRIARIKAYRGGVHAEVMALIGRIRQLDGLAESDADLRYTEGLSLINSGPTLVDRGVEVLAALHAAGPDPEGGPTALQIAERYGFSLVQRARFADSAEAVQVLEGVLARLEPGLHRDFVDAMRGLGKKIPEPPPEPEPEPEAEADEAVAQAVEDAGTR